MASENCSRRKTKQDLKIYLALCQSKLNNVVRIDRCTTEEALEEIRAGARASATDFDRRRRRRGRRRRAIFLDVEPQQVEDDQRDGSAPGGFFEMGLYLVGLQQRWVFLEMVGEGESCVGGSTPGGSATKMGFFGDGGRG
ncbi:hypothetical protein AAC387_Pa07g0338 [Persea americana]